MNMLSVTVPSKYLTQDGEEKTKFVPVWVAFEWKEGRYSIKLDIDNLSAVRGYEWSLMLFPIEKKANTF